MITLLISLGFVILSVKKLLKRFTKKNYKTQIRKILGLRI